MKQAWMAGAMAVLMAAFTAAAAEEDTRRPLEAQASEPRAYGYSIGDVVSRHVSIDVPSGLLLDTASLPSVGRRGTALEVRRVHVHPQGQRIEIDVDYQIFVSPHEVKTLEMPSFVLHFNGTPRPQDVRVEAWPVTVAPLVPAEVSPRRGLGELQPDRPAPLIDTSASTWRLAAEALVALVLVAYLALVYLGLPWWSRRHRPFTQAFAAVRGLAPGEGTAQSRAALQHLHAALNRSAGHVLFESGIEPFIKTQPRFAPLRDELARFFHVSRAAFFDDASAASLDRRWLLDFSRRCRDAERGAA